MSLINKVLKDLDKRGQEPPIAKPAVALSSAQSLARNFLG